MKPGSVAVVGAAGAPAVQVEGGVRSARIIEVLGRSGSISKTARELGMSYRRCWLLVDSLNHCFCEPVVQTATGGANGGGAQVTDFGREVLRRYRDIENKATESVRAELDELCGLIGPGPGRT